MHKYIRNNKNLFNTFMHTNLHNYVIWNSHVNFRKRNCTGNKHNLISNFFSGGQFRRVSLGISLLHDPKVIILDEPTVGIDPLLRHK